MLPPKRSTRSSLSLRKERQEEEVVQADTSAVKLEEAKYQEKAEQVGIESEALPEQTTDAGPGKEDTTTTKKARRKLTSVQRSELEALAEQTINPTLEARRALANQLGL